MAEPIKSITSLNLDLPPSCIAFCPENPRLFVVGTYYLHPREEHFATSEAEKAKETSESDDAVLKAAADEDEDDGTEEDQRSTAQQAQKRTGSLILFDLDPKTSEVTRLQTLPISSAILDIQWRPRTTSATPSSDLPILATATSTGSVHFHSLSFPASSEANAELRHLSTHQLTQSEAELCLYISWHPIREDILGATFNDGSAKVYIVHGLSSGRGLVVNHLTTLPSHSLEAWVLSFSPVSASVYTGGDDGVMLVSSLPATLDESSETGTSHKAEDDVDLPAEADILSARLTDRKSHQAGVTAILPLPSTETASSSGRELVLTGSYDDHIRLLSIPPAGQTGRAQVLAELDLGGGVWRLKFLPSSASSIASKVNDMSEAEGKVKESVILASCMHAGTRIVRLRHDEQDEEWHFEVLARFEEHKSMNYGTDVQMWAVDGNEKMKIVSTSFYDKLLCVWDTGW